MKTTARCAAHHHPRPLQIIQDLLRWQEWYDSKVPLFFVCFYHLCLMKPLPGRQALGQFALVTGFACLYLGFGYFINDFSDRECDRLAGKQKRITRLRGPVVVAALWILGLAGIAIPLTQIHDRLLAVGLTGANYFFAIFYSLPPIRFKERGIWGLIVSAAAQRALPVLVVFAILDHFSWDTWLFLLLFCLIGVRWILVHQLVDFKNDLAAGVRTFANQLGFKRTEVVLRSLILPLEVITLLALWGWLIFRIRGLWVIPFGYLIVMMIHWALWKGIGRPYTLAAYGRLPLAGFYFAYWPLALATVLAVQQPVFWLILGFNVLWQGRYLLRSGRTAVHLLRVKLGLVEPHGVH